MSEYGGFLESKAHRIPELGRTVDDGSVHQRLFPFQRDIVKWAVKRGRAAIFADCGLGKTLMQLEWARLVGGRALIVAPLAVAEQTMAEGTNIGVEVRRVARPDSGPGIQITNYEKLSHFVGADFNALVLDESSILKSQDGKTRTMILREFSRIPFRLACTATPAPNDISELANHSEFIGAMSRVEMLATFFVHDENGWRLKGHAADAMWKWMAQWSVYVRRPSDLGYDDAGFLLPKLTIKDEVTRSDWRPEGMLFAANLGGVGGRQKVRRATLGGRVEEAARIINGIDEQWIVWCGLNEEGRRLKDALNGEAALIEGADSEDDKIAEEHAWRSGDVRVLITKPSMFGFGLNWQHCRRMLFLGIGDSYEQYYQAIRRCWRFGQESPVDVRIVVSDAEGQIAANVRRKEAEAAKTAEGVVDAMRDEQTRQVHGEESRGVPYVTDDAAGENWRLMLGDCVERIREVDTASVGLSVFSPPFAALYTYSASDRDMGNSRDYDQFFRHFGYLIPELLRVTMPGRRACVHVQQVTTTKAIHGVIGWRDFRADTVREFVSRGWVYDGEVVIDKDPQAQAIRTKAKALMFVQKNKDSAWSRPAMADYILLFRAPGDNPQPVKTDVTNEEWICWARPIWYGIRESDTLQYREARSEKDEKHICPLQLETIERCIRLWSNPGDVILSPFAGIGSEGYVALKHGRKFVGIELKAEYWSVAKGHLNAAQSQLGLFSGTK
jgi:DNA modification methylase